MSSYICKCVLGYWHTHQSFHSLYSHEDVGRGWIAVRHCGWVWGISIQFSILSRSLITRSVHLKGFSSHLLVRPFLSVCCKGVAAKPGFYIHSQNMSQPLELEVHLLTKGTSLALHKMLSLLIWSHLGGTSYGMLSITSSSPSGWWTLSLPVQWYRHDQSSSLSSAPLLCWHTLQWAGGCKVMM